MIYISLEILLPNKYDANFDFTLRLVSSFYKTNPLATQHGSSSASQTARNIVCKRLPRQRVIVKEHPASLGICDAEFKIVFSAENVERHAVRAFIKRHRRESSSAPHVRTPPAQHPAEGGKLPYEEIEYVGDGSFGKVIRVTDLRTGDHLAMKVILIRDQDGESMEDKRLRVNKEVKQLKNATHVRDSDLPCSPWRWANYVFQTKFYLAKYCETCSRARGSTLEESAFIYEAVHGLLARKFGGFNREIRQSQPIP